MKEENDIQQIKRTESIFIYKKKPVVQSLLQENKDYYLSTNIIVYFSRSRVNNVVLFLHFLDLSLEPRPLGKSA